MSYSHPPPMFWDPRNHKLIMELPDGAEASVAVRRPNTPRAIHEILLEQPGISYRVLADEVRALRRMQGRLRELCACADRPGIPIDVLLEDLRRELAGPDTLRDLSGVVRTDEENLAYLTNEARKLREERIRVDGTCACGHVMDEHEFRNGQPKECCVDGCRCFLFDAAGVGGSDEHS